VNLKGAKHKINGEKAVQRMAEYSGDRDRVALN